jgi:hypothetical protein
MNDERIERLRQINAAAAPAPWSAKWVRISPPLVDADCELVATARNILPAVVNLLEGVLGRHKPGALTLRYCAACSNAHPCPDRTDALAVLQEVDHGR